MNRRQFLHVTAAALAAPAFIGRAGAQPIAGGPLPIPEIVDLGGAQGATLTTMAGTSRFLEGLETPTVGYSQAYLGPVLRMKRGEIARPVLKNGLGFPVTAHWHGLHVPGAVDGGPQLAMAPNDTWAPELNIDQSEATLWYHSHIHGETGPQVLHGLAGMVIVDDPQADNPDLPATWGTDDIPMVIQDRRFGADGRFAYDRRGPNFMHGFRGAHIMVNGAITPVASVTRGLVRLRLVNGSNARIYTLGLRDGRPFHQIATDGGYLTRPVAKSTLVLPPAARAEILVDLSDGKDVALVSTPDTNSPMGGMMGGMMGAMGEENGPQALDSDGRFEIATLRPDRPANAARLPARLSGAPGPITAEPVRRRSFSLEMGPAAMRRGAPLAINGRAYDMGRIDVQARIGEAEIWDVSSTMMAHPFHVHGTSFQVLSVDGVRPDFDETGLKDILLIHDRAEILVNFTQPATAETPYMFHCHILEHEDGGMMGQFTVT